MAASMVSTAIGARVSYTASSEILHKSRIQSLAPPPSRRRHVAIVRAEGGINPAIRKEEGKVVDSVVLADLSKPLTAYCRCWRSGTFPLCDGSHVKHNKATGDNVGPLLLKKEK